MCFDVKVVERDGMKVVQYLDYFGNVEFEQELEPIEKLEEQPITVSINRKKVKA